MPWRVVCCLVGMVWLVACQSQPRTVSAEIDGGTSSVAVLGDVVIAAAPGYTIAITHAGAPGGEAPTTHALVTDGGGALPPVFSPVGGGLSPNPAVWGQCRGGSAADADGACPAPPADGPAAWDGATYWSTGALLPGETREVPLAEDLAAGDHALVCALHPDLRVVVRVGADEVGEPAAAPAVVDAAQAATEALSSPPGEVHAGLAVEDPPAYVERFVPETARVTAGETVTFRAQGRAPVDVVFGAAAADLELTHTTPAEGLPEGNAARWRGEGVLRSGFLSADPTAGAVAAEFEVRFMRPGTYRYASRFADGMHGTVVVEEAQRD